MLQVRDVEAASRWYQAAVAARIEQARAAGATVAQEVGWNSLAHHHEATLVDPDGYVVVLHGAFAPEP